MEEKQMKLALSFVLCQKNPEIDSEQISTFLSQNWSELPLVEGISQKGTVTSFQVGTSEVYLGVMPAGYPATDLEGPISTSILWKNAATELKDHSAHIIVSVRADLNPVEMSTLLTQVTAAVMSAADSALGVYWGNAALIVPKDLFTEFAVEVLPQTLPLDIWVDFRVGWNGEKTSAGFTTGMTALGHMEFETTQSTDTPGDLRERFSNLANYVLENGPVIKDGDTVGGDEQEKILVTVADSAFGIDGKIMRLDFIRD